MKKMQVRKPATTPAKPEGVIRGADLDKVVGSGGAAGGVADKLPIQSAAR
jgi:hypothetical protein